MYVCPLSQVIGLKIINNDNLDNSCFYLCANISNILGILPPIQNLRISVRSHSYRASSQYRKIVQNMYIFVCNHTRHCHSHFHRCMLTRYCYYIGSAPYYQLGINVYKLVCVRISDKWSCDHEIDRLSVARWDRSSS